MRLIKEYVRSVISELKVDRKFVGRLRQSTGPSLASKGRAIATSWIQDYESYDDQLSPKDKAAIVGFASERYSKAFRKHDNDDNRATAELHRLLDLKFASLKLK